VDVPAGGASRIVVRSFEKRGSGDVKQRVAVDVSASQMSGAKP
jgi:hypothetical protein